MNIENALLQNIKYQLQKKVDLLELRQAVVNFRDSGGTQAGAYNILLAYSEELSDESQLDRLHEILDFVTGFCSTHMKIWETYYNPNI